MNPEPKYLLFDFGGVLVDLDYERCLAAFAELGFDVRPYIGTFGQAGLFSALESGRATVAEFCEGLRQMGGRPDLTDQQICHAWEQFLVGIPAERLEALLRIGRHYPLYVLSNTNPIHWAQAEQQFFRLGDHCVTDFFRHTFLSYELGCEKPAPEIFRRVVEGIGCEPGDILFFDDSEANCEAARRCGMQARLAPAGGSWLGYFTPEGRYQP